MVILLRHNQCNVLVATEKVTQQVGYQIILLDSKCLPVLTVEGKSGQDYWKSQRNSLVASWSVFERLTGKSSNVELTEAAATVDLKIYKCTENGQL